ncbi:Lrp/AsnC ligand binding domain-containing protein [Kineosporia babensis]|nr:Lrp/AsnC ligand binding domain-containing protein [Kineosporia babensis]
MSGSARTVEPLETLRQFGQEKHVVVQAYILIQTEVGRSTSIVTEIAQIPGVTLAEDVTGPYDIIARIEAPSVDELGQGVIAKIQDVKGITRTLTCTVVKM